MFTNIDVRGVSRGECMMSGCECDGFTRPSSLDWRSIQVAPLQCGWCCYCGHAPVSHSRLVANEGINGTLQPEISSVNWGGSVQIMLDNAGRESSMDLEPAQLMDSLEVAACRPFIEPEANPEVELYLQQEASPQLQAVWLREEKPQLYPCLQPAQSPKPKGASVPESEPRSESLKKATRYEQELSTCTCGLRQKVQQLEQEKQDLMRQLADARNISESGQLVKELKGILHKEDSGTTAVEPRKVDIGGGVMVDGKLLDQLLSSQHNTPSRFARCLTRALFTREELKGKSLFGKSCNRFKALNLKQKPALDPVRINAVIGFTCKTFSASPHELKSSLASMLCRKIKEPRE